nr:coat protein [Betapartitivirus sp. 'aconiti']
MSTSSTNPRLSAIKSKAVNLVFQDLKIPDSSADILDLFRANTAARTDSSNEWTIDVFPNITPILMYVMLMSIRHAESVQHREHSKSSVATICMYHMSVVYGFFLLNDLYVRPAKSAHARSWVETSWKNDFVTFLLSLPMPEFLAPILSQFHSFETERSRNIFFVPSAAGFDHDQFFGRVFPLNMFAAIHDCAATLPGNSTRNQVLQDLYSRTLYSITNPAFTCVIPDLIGITIDQTTNTTANYMNSKLFQVFSSMFNPVLFRDFQRRSSLAALSFNAPRFATNNVNAYDLLFSATSANLRELKVVLQAISAIISDSVVCKSSLSSFISEPSASSIIKHGYSSYALPTWSHNENANKPTLFAAVTTQTLVSEEDRAQDISFLQRPAAAIPTDHTIRQFTYAASAALDTPVAITANHTIVPHFPIALRHRTTQQNGFPRHDNESLVQFSDAINTAPSVLVLDTDGDQTISAYLPLLAGKIIESFELDGSTIEMPDASKSLGMQNCMFADSAIAYKYVRPGSHYQPRAAGSIHPPLNRALPNSRPRLPASSLLHDRLKIMLPRFNRAIHEQGPFATLPGMTPITPVNVMRYVQSFIGFRTVDGSSNAAALDAVPGMSEQLLLVWSPYTYTPYESDDYPTPNLGDSRHYYLTNLRTFFGTDYKLVQCKHPYESLPVV